jgi:hypothetical protein
MNLSVIVDGVEYSLSDGTLTTLLGEDGLGMAGIRRMEERGPAQRGSTDRGFRYDPRLATYLFGITAWSASEMQTKRDLLTKIFRPSRPLIMKHVLGNGKVRYLDCVFYSGLDMPANDRTIGRFQKAKVSIKADDPTFYDPVGKSLTFAMGGGSGGWVFPWAIPWTIGGSSIDQSKQVPYGGGVGTYPALIRITGPMTDPRIENSTTGEVLDFAGTTIDPGDYYDIDLRYGLKTVVDAAGNDVFDALTIDSDHATWHIAADDEVPGGINSIRVRGTAMTATTRVEISYFERELAI